MCKILFKYNNYYAYKKHKKKKSDIKWLFGIIINVIGYYKILYDLSV